jgi:hypothetical protein
MFKPEDNNLTNSAAISLSASAWLIKTEFSKTHLQNRPY